MLSDKGDRCWRYALFRAQSIMVPHFYRATYFNGRNFVMWMQKNDPHVKISTSWYSVVTILHIFTSIQPFLYKIGWNHLNLTITLQWYFPASRGLFSVVFAELMGVRKRDLCPGSKQTVLSMPHGYLATELSHGAVGLCGLTKWQWSNCKQMRERQWSQVTVSKQYRDCALSVVHNYRQWLNQSPFWPRAEVSFPHTHQFSEYNGKRPLQGGKMIQVWPVQSMFP